MLSFGASLKIFAPRGERSHCKGLARAKARCQYPSRPPCVAEPAASGRAPFQDAGIIWAIRLGYAAFDDVPDLALIAGSAIIIGAGLFTLWRERGAEAG